MLLAEGLKRDIDAQVHSFQFNRAQSILHNYDEVHWNTINVQSILYEQDKFIQATCPNHHNFSSYSPQHVHPIVFKHYS